MNKKSNLNKIGFVLLAIGAIFFILDKVLEIESIVSITSYGKYIFMFGGAFLGMGLFGKEKSKEN